MDNPKQDNYGLKRLQSKTARNAIVLKLANDFNLTPIIAEAYYQQFTLYFQEHANVSLSTGEIASQLQSLARHLLDHPDAGNFLHFEQRLHQQFVKAADIISEQVFLEMISKPDFIEQAINKYRSKGYRVHSRNRSTIVQLKGGRTVRIKTVYMLLRQSKKKGRKRGVGKRGRQGKGIYPVLKLLGIAHQSFQRYYMT